MFVSLLLLIACGTTEASLQGETFVGDGTAQVAPPAGTLDLWVEPIIRGQRTTLRASGATPGQVVYFLGTGRGTGAGPCRNGLCSDLLSPTVLGHATAGADGTATVTPMIPATLPVASVDLQAMAWGPAGVTPVRTVDVIDAGDDLADLLTGTTTIDIGGSLPSQVAMWQPFAFPLLLDADGRTLVAGARVNEGKVVVAGHESIILGSPVTAGLGGDDLVRNAISWMGGANPRVGVEAGMGSLQAWLVSQGYSVVVANPSQLSTVDVWFANLHTDRSDVDDSRIRTWVADGGGMIAGGHAWYWGYSHTNPAINHPGDQVLRDTGLLVTTDTTSGGVLTFPNTPPSPLSHGSNALDAILDHLDGTTVLPLGDLATASSSVSFTARFVPLTWSAFYDRADQVLAAIGPVVPTDANPVTPDTEPLEGLALTLLDAYAQGLPAADLQAHPAASDFPGASNPGSPRVSRTLTVSGSQTGRDSRYMYADSGDPAWRSTGLYAEAGEVLTVTIDAAAAGHGLRAQIGAHTDTLWGLDSWARSPSIVRSYPLDTVTTEIASAFGGLVYITVPNGSALGNVTVTITGGVEAAWFRKGVDSDAAWMAGGRFKPAPWAEIEGDNHILTVPSFYARTLSNPEALIAWWDSVLDAEADLAMIPHNRPRKERSLTDRQISAGWMHSGYPFMAYNSVAPDFLNLATLQSGGDWGAFHELGHNHQWAAWHLPGATEATVNLWSTYVMENVVGLPVGHPALNPADRAQRINDYVVGGRDFWNDWSVWTNLETWLQLKEAFGWNVIQTMIADYNDDLPASDPTTDQARIDRVATRLGHEVGLDLGPFFLAWGWPLSPAVVADLATYPAWTADPMNP